MVAPYTKANYVVILVLGAIMKIIPYLRGSRRFHSGIAVGAFLFAISVPADAGSYIPFNVHSSTSTFPSSVSSNGYIAGSWANPGEEALFVRSPVGSITTFQLIYGNSSTSPLVNATGAVAGTYYDKQELPHGYIRNPDGSIVTVDGPSDDGGTMITGISDAGFVVGSYISNDDTWGLIRTPKGTAVPFLGPNNEQVNQVIGINSKNTTLATYVDFKFYGFFLTSKFKYTAFSLEQDDGTVLGPIAFNVSGNIAGVYSDINNVQHCFVRQKNGNVTKFDVPNSNRCEVIGIDGKGNIAGNFFGVSLAGSFLRTPKGKFKYFSYAKQNPLLHAMGSSGELAAAYVIPKNQNVRGLIIQP